MTMEQRLELRDKIDNLMKNQVWYGGDRQDTSEDIFWMWYDIEEMTDLEEIRSTYETIGQMLTEQGVI